MIIRKYPDIHNYLSLDKEVGIRLPTSLKNILPSISFPSIPSFKYFSYNPPSSSAYNKDHRPWHNHDLIQKATPKNGGCGSTGFPACGTTQPHTSFLHQETSGSCGRQRHSCPYPPSQCGTYISSDTTLRTSPAAW